MDNDLCARIAIETMLGVSAPWEELLPSTDLGYATAEAWETDCARTVARYNRLRREQVPSRAAIAFPIRDRAKLRKKPLGDFRHQMMARGDKLDAGTNKAARNDAFLLLESAQ